MVKETARPVRRNSSDVGHREPPLVGVAIQGRATPPALHRFVAIADRNERRIMIGFLRGEVMKLIALIILKKLIIMSVTLVMLGALLVNILSGRPILSVRSNAAGG